MDCPKCQKNEMEPIILTLHPHKKSHVLSAYQGQEFGYVLKGSVTIVQGSKKYKVKLMRLFTWTAQGAITCIITVPAMRRSCGSQRRRCSRKET